MLKGWNTPSVGWLTTDGGRDIPQGVLPTPEQPQHLVLEVTDAESFGEDHFELNVHTPDTLEDQLRRNWAILGRGIVVVFAEYVPERVAEAFRPAVESTSGETWEEVAYRVARLGDWEWEGTRWNPETREIEALDGVRVLVRDVRLSAQGAPPAGFSVEAEVIFGGSGVPDTFTVPVVVQDPRWLREHHGGADILLGAGRVFAAELDPAVLRAGIQESLQVLEAPSWELLRSTLEGLGKDPESFAT